MNKIKKYFFELGNRIIDEKPILFFDIYSAIVFVLGTFAGILFFGR